MSMRPEELAFTERAFKLGGFIQTQLGVEVAALTHPVDLVACGVVAYAGQEGRSLKLFNINPRQTVNDVIKSVDPAAIRRLAGTPERLLSHYPKLVGNGDYEKGTIVAALKASKDTLVPQQAEALEREMAILLGYYFVIKPDFVHPPEVRVDPQRREVRFNNGPIFPLSAPPTAVMEYGPGLVAAHKIPNEIRLTPLKILIENSVYVNQALVQYAGLKGLQYPRVIGREDGISSATEELLRGSQREFIDVVIMSMVHSAGVTEIEAGIVNGRRLLKRGGLMVVQSPNEVNEGEAPGDEVFKMLKDHFGANPRIRQDYSYLQSTTGKTITGFKTIFER